MVEPLVRAHPNRFDRDRMTFEAFKIASSWVASRAFYVDEAHGALTRAAVSSAGSGREPMPAVMLVRVAKVNCRVLGTVGLLGADSKRAAMRAIGGRGVRLQVSPWCRWPTCSTTKHRSCS